MIEYYAQIRLVHVLAAAISGALFAVRGAGVLAGAVWPMHAPLRFASYAIDTALLAAALMLVAILPGATFANHWLTTKVALVIVYIVLGSFALKRARTRRGRSLCYVAALSVFALVIAIARSHSPAPWLGAR